MTNAIFNFYVLSYKLLKLVYMQNFTIYFVLFFKAKGSVQGMFFVPKHLIAAHLSPNYLSFFF